MCIRDSHVDRFHWTIHLNKVLDSARKALRKKDKDEEAYKRLKWKLIKRYEQNLRTLTLRKVLSDHFSLNNISELIPIINVALIYSFF